MRKRSRRAWPRTKGRVRVLAGESDQELETTLRANGPGEARFEEPAIETETRARLLHQRGVAKWALRRWEQALEDWREAFPLFESLRDGVALAKLLHGMSVVPQWTARHAETPVAGGRAERIIGEFAPTGEWCRVLCQKALAAAGQLDFDTASDAFAAAEAIVAKLGDLELESEVLGFRVVVSGYFCERELEERL